jgi:hypothetical protein
MMNFDKVTSLGETTTIVKDFSQYNNTGTANGATWTGNGKQNGGYYFDGVNDYINLGTTSSLNPTTNMTIIAWIKGDNFGDANMHNVITRWDQGSEWSYILRVIS